MLTHLLDDVKKRMADDTCPDCLTAQTVREQEKNGMDDLEIAYAISSPFGAGIETVGVFFMIIFDASERMPRQRVRSL